MTVRLLLVAHAATTATTAAAFPDDEPITGRGAEPLGPDGRPDPPIGQALRGPELRCAQTAARLGLHADPAEALRDWDAGRWRGRRLADVQSEDPDGVGRWLSDPGAAPHGGESVLDVIDRVAWWLGELPDARLVAVTHPAVIRAAVVHALRVAPETFWRLDVEPLARVALTGRDGRWNLRFGARP